MKASHYVDEVDGKFRVVRMIEGESRERVVWEGTDRDEAESELEGFEEAWYAEQEARASGDDPRYEEPDDPHAAQHELWQQMREQY